VLLCWSDCNRAIVVLRDSLVTLAPQDDDRANEVTRPRRRGVADARVPSFVSHHRGAVHQDRSLVFSLLL